MANNRMWLVCPAVGPNTHEEPAKIILGKASTTWHSTLAIQLLDGFLENHSDCGYAVEGQKYPLGTTIHFQLEYEQTEE